jgi:hypothetical protein
MKKLLFISFIGLLFGLTYFVPREQFTLLILLFTIAFVVMEMMKRLSFSLKEVFWIGLICRLLCMFEIPMLSDDYFRFLWDGSMTMNGVSPFECQPEVYIDKFVHSSYLKELYNGMNSKAYFSVYPPLNQLIFYLANLISGSNVLGGVIVIRIFLLVSEILLFKGLVKLLQSLKLDTSLVVYYFLNPMIIMELFVNVHMESIMLAGFVWMVIFLFRKQYLIAALAFFISVNGKLHTLMFIPLLLSFIPFKQFLKFILVFGFLLMMSFLPFINLELIQNMQSSFTLYFQSFEFNASLFYLIREVGFSVLAYDVIKTVGPILSFLSVLTILIVSWKKRGVEMKDFVWRSMVIFLVFLLLSTTVHPWYVSLALLLGLLNNFRSMVLWSLLILLTYATYLSDVYKENLYLVLLEYLTVGVVLLVEIRAKLISK